MLPYDLSRPLPEQIRFGQPGELAEAVYGALKVREFLARSWSECPRAGGERSQVTFRRKPDRES